MDISREQSFYKFSNYKYCFVPKCTNTNMTTPEKVFLSVPVDKIRRNKWMKAVRREDTDSVTESFQSCFHCCSDHFNIPEDFGNYIKYSIAGGDLCVKNGVVPHIFNCQPSRTLAHVKEGQTNFTLSSDIELLHSPLSSNCVKDLVDKVTVKNSPGVEIQQYDTNADSEPTWLSLEVKTIKEESKDSPSSVFNHYDGCNEEINHENRDKDLVDWSETTIKKEPDVEIDQNSSEAASSSNWLSFEVKSIKQENEDSENGVVKKCEARPEEFDEHEDVDEDIDEETFKNVMSSSIFEKNVGDVKENLIEKKLGSRTQTAKFKMYKCDICHKVFTKCALTTHMRLHTNKRAFKCDICLKCFSFKGNLKTHMRIHKNEKPFECDFCHKCFNQNGSLTIHKRIHTKDKAFKCDICHKYFSRSDNLKTHMRIHNNEKPFEFDVCQKGFNTNGGLTIHKRVNTKDFKCDICLKSFRFKGMLKTHMRIHNNERPFECDFCHKCFTENGRLTRHKRIHTKDKAFKCDICLKSFIFKSNLKRHVHIHNNEKPFQCNNCHKCFMKRRNLTRHICLHF